jgi:RNA polymerase sigma factor (sigma-70 family)
MPRFVAGRSERTPHGCIARSLVVLGSISRRKSRGACVLRMRPADVRDARTSTTTVGMSVRSMTPRNRPQEQAPASLECDAARCDRASSNARGRYPTSEELEHVRREIHGYAYLRLRDSDLAEDVAQEALARCLTVIGKRGLPPNCTLGSYVAGIARHIVLDLFRRGDREVPLRAADVEGRFEEAMIPPPDTPDSVSRLPTAIESLSSEERFVIRRHFLDGIQCAEIARGLGVAPARVRKQKQRALEKIRVALGSNGREVRADSRATLSRADR